MDKKPFNNINTGINLEQFINVAELRYDGRKPDQLRPVKFTLDFTINAKASVLVEMGNTKVICAVSVDESVPGWMRQQNVEGGLSTHRDAGRYSGRYDLEGEADLEKLANLPGGAACTTCIGYQGT